MPAKRPMPPIAACTLALAPAGERQVLMPAGRFDASGGAMQGKGPWLLTAAGAARVIQRARERGIRIAVDYEHQTLLAATNGQDAPASGWIQPADLAWQPDQGIIAPIDWTERAAARIAAREYLYLSPVFRYDPNTGEVQELLHLALTNTPGIDQMPELVRAAAKRATPTEESQMDELLKLFGLKAGSTEAEAIAALTALQTERTDLLAQLAQKDQAIAAAKAGSPDPSKYVPVAALEELRTELAALKVGSIERSIEDLIAPAIADGRIPPSGADGKASALETWARDLGKTNLAALKTYLDTAQPIAALRGSQTGGKPPAAGGIPGLDEQDLAICKQLGVKPAGLQGHPRRPGGALTDPPIY